MNILVNLDSPDSIFLGGNPTLLYVSPSYSYPLIGLISFLRYYPIQSFNFNRLVVTVQLHSERVSST